MFRIYKELLEITYPEPLFIPIYMSVTGKLVARRYYGNEIGLTGSVGQVLIHFSSLCKFLIWFTYIRIISGRCVNWLQQVQPFYIHVALWFKLISHWQVVFHRPLQCVRSFPNFLGLEINFICSIHILAVMSLLFQQNFQVISFSLICIVWNFYQNFLKACPIFLVQAAKYFR